MSLFLRQFSLRFTSLAALLSVVAVIAIESLVGPTVRGFSSHEVDETLLTLNGGNWNQDAVLLGDSVGRGIFAGWRSDRGTLASLACNQATETSGNYFFLKRYLEHNRPPGAVIICDRSPLTGNLEQNLTENYVQRCFTKWQEIAALFRAKLDPVFTAKMLAYKLFATFKNRLHLQKKLVGFTNSDIYTGLTTGKAGAPHRFGLFEIVSDLLARGRGASISFLFFEKMIKDLENRGIPVWYLPPPTTTAIDDSHHLVEHSLAALQQLSASHPGFHVMRDAYSRMAEENFSDSVHLNNNGLALYRPAIQPRIDAILRNAAHRSDMMRAALFNRSRPLFSYAGEKQLRLITPFNNTAIGVINDSLVVSATTIDPAVLLPEIKQTTLSPGESIAIKVILQTEQATTARFYFSETHGAFSQKHSVAAPIRPDRDTYFLLLPNWFQGGTLRFDPGEVAGQYTVTAIVGKILTVGDSAYF